MSAPTETFNKILNAIIDAVRKEGAGYTYTGLTDPYDLVYFTPDGEPSCLIGHALPAVGITAADAERGGWNGKSVRLAIEEHHILSDLTVWEVEVLAGIQWRQDYGCLWGKAVLDALDPLPWHGSEQTPPYTLTPEQVAILKGESA